MSRTVVLIDTNLLDLLVVGSVRPDLIGKHRRTKGYGVQDFALLREMLGESPTLSLRPNVVTETSNLVTGYGEPDRSRLLRRPKVLVEADPESYVPSRLACPVAEFIRLGVTDAALLVHDAARRAIYTDDLDLEAAMNHGGRLYWSHFRMIGRRLAKSVAEPRSSRSTPRAPKMAQPLRGCGVTGDWCVG